MNQNATILLVEDNSDDERLTLRAFRKNNFHNPILVAHDGAEALQILHDPARPPFTLVLLDLKLPKVPGLEVLKRMREDPRTRLTPVVILTSSQEESDIASSYEMRANSYVRKPVDFHAFVDAVAKLGMYWLMVNEPPGTAAT